MRQHKLPAVAFAVLGAACNAGPEPKDASNPGSVPIHNSAAVIENFHAAEGVEPSPEVLILLRELDRDPRDVALDARYQAADFLTFLDPRAGDRVAEVSAGGGYFTELFARAVGPNGRVFANLVPALVPEAVARAFAERLERPVNSDVMRTDRELASPLPDDARSLDLVYMSLPYRTAENIGIDTRAMDLAIFGALKPAGRFVVVDYRPRMSGPSRVNLHALHEEESANARRQIEAAGFRFVTEGRFLRNDPRRDAWDGVAVSSPTSLEEQDRFLLEFRKP
jgi:predicted methyltransferase